MGTKHTPRHTGTGRGATILTVLVLVLAVIAAGFMGRLTAEPVVEPPTGATGQRTTSSAPQATGTPDAVPDGERLVISGDTAAGALLILLTAGLALLVRFLLRFRRQRIEGGGLLEQTDVHRSGSPLLVDDTLPAWTAEAERTLKEGTDTSDAVIRCWLAFERLCAAAGVDRTPAQTTSDFAASAAAALALPSEPLAILNRLYQRARFGQTGGRGGGQGGPEDSAAAGAGAGTERLGAVDRDLALGSIRALSAVLAARTGSTR